jgi:hypothetical protein
MIWFSSLLGKLPCHGYARMRPSLGVSSITKHDSFVAFGSGSALPLAGHAVRAAGHVL